MINLKREGKELRMGNTSIEWTRGDDGTAGKTWNPVTGCQKVSEGCRYCYAERLFPRTAHSQTVVEDVGDDNAVVRKREFTDVRCHPERLEQPLHWRKPARIFVNSMSDLFHEDVPEEFIMAVWTTMAHANQHTYQILTKRPRRMLEMLSRAGRDGLVFKSGCGSVLPNVWLGVSVENQDTLHRIETLKDIPAAVRFVSFEPLLEHLGALILDRIDWAILGSESGPKARGYSTEWFESIVRQCEEQHVACFVKQLTIGGRKIPFEEWPGYLQVRQWPRTLVEAQ